MNLKNRCLYCGNITQITKYRVKHNIGVHLLTIILTAMLTLLLVALTSLK